MRMGSKTGSNFELIPQMIFACSCHPSKIPTPTLIPENSTKIVVKRNLVTLGRAAGVE